MNFSGAKNLVFEKITSLVRHRLESPEAGGEKPVSKAKNKKKNQTSRD